MKRKLKVGLFIPCYVDQFYPQVAKATLQLLRKFDCDVEYPTNQACCGQPMANAGFQNRARAAHRSFEKNFDRFDYVVSPSGSCVLYVRDHHPPHISAEEPAGSADLSERTWELCEFLTDVVGVESTGATCNRRVGLHQSCHGLRGLRLGAGSERQLQAENKVRSLLEMVDGITLVDLDRPDECCGFGGTFAVTEEAVSVRMGTDRLADHLSHRAEIITGTDMSCLMHLEGLARRRSESVSFRHVAEILNGDV